LLIIDQNGPGVVLYSHYICFYQAQSPNIFNKKTDKKSTPVLLVG